MQRRARGGAAARAGLLVVITLVLFGGCRDGGGTGIPPWVPPGGGEYSGLTPAEADSITYDALEPFHSRLEFDLYAGRLAGLRERLAERDGGYGGYYGVPDASDGAESDSDSGAARDDPSITNNQEGGVDEGDIVKAVGEFLVVLRRGRLYAVRQYRGEEAALEPVSQIDAFPPDYFHSAWYDEMLIYEDRIVVIGYSYALGATEIGLFRVDDGGELRHEATHFLTSNDYYSTRNYASRLVDGRLVLYMPFYLFPWGWDAEEGGGARFPSMSSWLEGEEVGAWSSVIEEVDVYRPVQPTLRPTLHTVVQCDLRSQEMACSATGILGPYSRSFYVSRDAVYLWVTPEHSNLDSYSVVYRMPFEGGTITAARAHGAPVDQFSFKESDGTHLNVVLVEHSWGDAMAAPEFAAGRMALLRVPLARLSRRPQAIRSWYYVPLPSLEEYSIQNRFVGDYLLYGSGNAWGWGYDTEDDERRVFVTAYRERGRVHEVPLTHGVDRIEAMGDAAVVVGSNGEDLVFSAIELDRSPRVVSTFVREDASQGETRSHGFFFHPDEGGGGVLGLPVRLTGSAWEHLIHGSAEVLFLRVGSDHEFSRLGALAADAEGSVDDSCVVSCVDWYGNARPIFYRGRVFALLGYELVEGEIGASTVDEVRRVSFYLGER